MEMLMNLFPELSKNIDYLKYRMPIGRSFDLINRDLILGNHKAFFIGINGFCKTEILQQIISDLQNPMFMLHEEIDDLEFFVQSKIGYAQVSLTDSFEDMIKNILSGPSALIIDGFPRAVLIDVRTYPVRSISEPDLERVTRGSKDGFVETLLFNTNLIRRRIRSPHLCFTMHTVGTESKTDVSCAYLDNIVNHELLEDICHRINSLQVTSLTMGSKSLEELLLPKRRWNPLPSIQVTERPDVACSYLLEGHILILVDNSPMALILPCTVFQFIQSPEDYYGSPSVGNYFRFVRFLCIPISLLLTPVFLLLTAYYPDFSIHLGLLSEYISPMRLFFYVAAVEVLLDLFKYSSSLSSGKFSGSLSIVGGLIIGDIAVSLNWATPEVLFYAAVTLLASLSIPGIELSNAIRIYRIFLVIFTGLGGLTGFGIALLLILLSVITTPTYGGFSYFWPLVPYNKAALSKLLFRSPTSKAQPSKVWNRGSVKNPKKHKKNRS